MTGRTNRYGFKTFSRTKEEFLQFYESHLEHQMMGLEKKRKKYSKAWIKRVVLTFIGLIVLLLLFLLPDDMETFLKVIIYINIIMVGLGYISFSYMKWQKTIENVVKEEVVPKLVTFMNPNFTYSPQDHMSKKDFDDTLMFRNKVDGFLGDDLIEGFVYDEVEGAQTNLSFSEIAAMNTKKSYTAQGKQINPVGIYVIGLFFKVDFNKDFGRSVTIIKPRWLMRKRKHRKKLAVYGKKSPLQEVHLENAKFMKEFIVHSNDQVNARVILQADTMQNLLDFVHYQSETIAGKRPKRRKRKHYIPYFTFRNNQIYLLLHTKKQHFHVDLLEKITIDTAYAYFRDINRILRLIDDLNLNLDVYK